MNSHFSDHYCQNKQGETQMNVNKKICLTIAGVCTMALGVVGSQNVMAQSYDTTFYVAGMGGHFAVAEATIDPSKKEPISLKKLDRIEIGDDESHPTHDPRIDSQDRNVMFWSTYKIDPETKAPHVGKSDLKTGEVIMDVSAPLPEFATKSKSLFCASGQTKDFYMPISMAHKGYIEVRNKSDLKLVHTVTLEGTDADIKKPYKFYHGVSSPDGKVTLITINEADKDHGKPIGKLHLLLLDNSALEQGKIKVLAKGMAPGAEGSFISFRAYFSDDGTRIAIGAADRMLIIDGKTLEVLDAGMAGPLEQFHDAIFTPDGKYVIATSRSKRIIEGVECSDPNKPAKGEFLMDGHLKLYDIQNKKWLGKSTSVCLSCHDNEELESHAVLCGIDANWK